MEISFGLPRTASGIELPLATEPMRVLDFDIENRPSAYWYQDKTTAEITAIAWAWYDTPEKGLTPTDEAATVHVKTLKAPPGGTKSALAMLKAFRRAYDAADMVTGHYIRKHDLPIINSHLIEFGLPPLGPKLTSDTKMDLVSYGDQSASQMALATALGVKKEKPRMTVSTWRDANRLTPHGIESTVERVTGDVRQHMELRLALIEHNLLKPPRVWEP